MLVRLVFIPERVEMTWAVREEGTEEELLEVAKVPPWASPPRIERMMRSVMEVVKTAAILDLETNRNIQKNR